LTAFEGFIFSAAGLLIMCLTSFINTCTYRLPQQRALTGRSKCLSCQHPLAICDLMPVFSYLFLKGTCRYCQNRIPKRIIILEISALVLIIGIGYIYRYHPPINTILLWLVIPPVLGTIVVDFEHLFIPNLFVLWITFVGILQAVYGQPINHILGMVSGAGVLVALGLLSKILYGTFGFGAGDIKLIAAMGLFLGFELTLLTLIAAIFMGGCLAIVGLALKKLDRQSKLPFGSFLGIAFILVILSVPILSITSINWQQLY
jgi:leader peptidase (prepilin peptidase) / N-methyltransferase